MRVAFLLVLACGPAQPPAAMPEPDAPFPLTRGEKQGQTYLYDPIVETSRACSPKSGTIELRLHTIDINRLTLRLTVKNCTSKEVRLLFDGDLQPSQLVFSGKSKDFARSEVRDPPSGENKVPPPDDDRAIRKFDTTIKNAAFVKIEPGEERVLEEAYIAQNGIQWQCWHYQVPSGSYSVKVRFTSKIAGGESKVPNAWLGTIESNAIMVHVR